jgi:hypothetical protein
MDTLKDKKEPKIVQNETDLGEGEFYVIEKHGREYLLSGNRLFTVQGKYIGWLNNGVYEPSTKILKKREKREMERQLVEFAAHYRLQQEREQQKKQRFEEAVRKRMNELRK